MFVADTIEAFKYQKVSPPRLQTARNLFPIWQNSCICGRLGPWRWAEEFFNMLLIPISYIMFTSRNEPPAAHWPHYVSAFSLNFPHVSCGSHSISPFRKISCPGIKKTCAHLQTVFSVRLPHPTDLGYGGGRNYSSARIISTLISCRDMQF